MVDAICFREREARCYRSARGNEGQPRMSSGRRPLLLRKEGKVILLIVSEQRSVAPEFEALGSREGRLGDASSYCEGRARCYRSA